MQWPYLAATLCGIRQGPTQKWAIPGSGRAGDGSQWLVIGRGDSLGRALRSSGKCRHHLGSQLLGALAQLVPIQVFDGVLSEDGGIFRRSPHGRHGRRGVNESVGANSGGRQASLLHVNPVVHTARTAGTSIADGDDHRIAVFRQLAQGRRVRGTGCAGLPVPTHLGNFVAGP